MKEIKLIKFKIKSGQKDVWLKWTKELVRRKKEVLKTLKKEGMLLESCFISKDEKYIYCLFESSNFKKANKIFEKSNKKIDIEHKKISKKSLKPIEELSKLFYFSLKK